MAFIEQYDPDYVLILSGDHIYKMDYNAMLYHIRKGADATIAVRPVPWEGCFGIMNTDADDNIVEFEEKPKQPKSNKASMGIYIFSWAKLRAYLTADEADSQRLRQEHHPRDAERQAGHGGIQLRGLLEGRSGAIESLEANMDLLSVPMPIDLHDKKWRIYAKNPGLAPHRGRCRERFAGYGRLGSLRLCAALRDFRRRDH